MPSASSRPFVALLLAAVPVLFLSLNANSIWDANEAFYVETPRQMVLSGDYVNPSFNGEPRFNKPVLSYWMVAGLYQVFGVSVSVERLGIALGALGLILATYLIGRALGTPLTGAMAAVFVATAPRVVMFSRRIFIDIWITCFMALTLACFVLAERHPERRRTFLGLMYVAIGLGVLTKGPIALVLPAAVGLVWLVMERRLGDIRRLRLLPGGLIVLAIVAPWYAMQYAEHGWTYIQAFFIGENVGRFANSMVPGERSVFFYLPVLFGDLFPWAPLLMVPILTAWRGRRDSEIASEASIRRLLWVWIVLTVALFSSSATKQDLYIFSVVPAVAALVAHALVQHDFGRAHRGLRTALIVVCALCLAAGAGVLWLFTTGPYALRDAAVLAAMLVAVGTATAVLLWRGRGATAVVTLAAGFVALNYVFVLRALPDTERLKPVPPIASVYLKRAGPAATLASFRVSLPSLVYYARRPVTDLGSATQAMDLLGGAGEAWLVTHQGEWTALGRAVPAACVAERWPDFAFNAPLSAMLRRTPPRDIVLVTNQCGGRPPEARPH